MKACIDLRFKKRLARPAGLDHRGTISNLEFVAYRVDRFELVRARIEACKNGRTVAHEVGLCGIDVRTLLCRVVRAGPAFGSSPSLIGIIPEGFSPGHLVVALAAARMERNGAHASTWAQE